MSLFVDALADLVRQSIGDADATRQEWESALDQIYGSTPEEGGTAQSQA